MTDLQTTQQGLQRAGFEVLVQTLGSSELPVELLRIRTPHTSIEAAQQWLLRELGRCGDPDLLSGVSVCLAQRSRAHHLFAGADEEVESLAQRIESQPTSPADLLVPGRCLQVVSSQRHLYCYPRTAIEVVRCLPGVRACGPEPVGDPRRWLAIDVAHEPGSVAALVDCGRGLDALGFTTSLYTWRDGASALLVVDAGDSMSDELEVQIDERLSKSTSLAARPEWLRPYRPWSWSGALWVHRQPASDGWLLRAWLERQLGLPVVEAQQPPGKDVWIAVPPSLVDRALALLAQRPAPFGPRDVEGAFVPRPQG